MTTDQPGGAGQEDRGPDQGRDSSGTASRTTAGKSGTSRSGQAGRQSRSRQSSPGADMLSDFQRWLIRSSAKNMRKEISGQVRRTFGGGRSESGDVWDTATTEIPPEVGEAPECQWCPICRAARRMRESGPGLGDHLLSAGDAVAAVVQDALGAVDSVLSRGGGSAQSRRTERDAWAADADGWAAARDSWAAQHGAMAADHGPGGEERGAQAAEHDAQAEEHDARAEEHDAQAEEHDARAAEHDAQAEEPGSGREEPPAEPTVTTAHDMTDEPDGTDEPDDRG
jgi:hypothetical protein